jgi:PAS domain S-box-containing protein
MTPSLSQPNANPEYCSSASDLEDVLLSSGEIGALISTYNWSQNPLGTMETWSGSLCTAIRMLLKSDAPMLLIWGQDWIQIYNPAYSCLLKPHQHPRTLGQSARVYRSMLWAQLSPTIQQVWQTGQPQWHPSLSLLKQTQNSDWEKSDFTVFYSPVWTEMGDMGGVLITMMETSPSVVSRSPQGKTDFTEPLTPKIWQRQKRQNKTIGMTAMTPKLMETQPVTVDVMKILDEIRDGFMILDHQGHCLYFNPATTQILNLSASRLKGQILWEILPFLAPPLQQVKTQSQTLTWETFYDSEQIWLEFKAYPGSEGFTLYFQEITQRKQPLSEAKWRLTEERLRVALKNSPVTVFSQDPDLRYTWIYNCPKEKYPSDEAIIGLLETDLFNAEDAKKLTQIKSNVLNTGIGTREEVWVNQQGQSFCFDLTVEPLFNEQEQVIGVTCAAVNMTERKQIELALYRSETLLQALLSSSPVGLAFLDHDLRYLHANEALAMIQGVPLSQLIGQSLATVLPEWANQMTPLLRQVIETQKPILNQPLNLEIPSLKTYQYTLVSYYPVGLPNGDVLGVGMTVMDLTARKRAEQSEQVLAEASSVLVSSLNSRTTLMNLAQLLVPTVADCCFFDVASSDGSLRRLAVYHRDSSKHQQLSQRQNWTLMLNSHHPIAQVLTQGQSVLLPQVDSDWIKTITTVPEQVEFLQTVAPTSWISVPLIARDRKLGAVTFCLTAQSHRHYTDADLTFAEELADRAALALDNIQLYQQAQDVNRIKDEFLAVLSHELRSPLNPILGWTKLLRSRTFDPSTTNRALDTIERNAKLQAQLIEDLLDISRILRGKMALNVATVSVPETIEAALETVRLAAEAKNITLKTVFSPQIGLVWGDGGRLQQVIWNLLSNAVKFTPEGGRIQVRLQQVNHQVEIQVEDNGRGINRHFLPLVFDCFRQEDSSTTRQFGGLGLGLAIVRHLCELHGGTISVESPGEGFGTTFTVRLPVMENGCECCATVEETPATVNLEGMRILVVDDDEDMRDLIQVILEPLGAKLLTTSSAREALQVWEDFQPLMLICDIGMPGMDGYMLMHKIRQRPLEVGGQIPAIALTAYAGEFNQRRALAAGFQQYLSKPIEPEHLVKAISQLLT